MNAGLTKLLASLCMVLALIVALEWYYTKHSVKQFFEGFETKQELLYDNVELPSIKLSHLDVEAFADLINRPLFIEGRRPLPEIEGEDVSTAAVPESFEWQLMGVYTLKDSLTALFSRKKKMEGRPDHLKKTLGEDIEGWELTEIQPDRAILESSSNRLELILRKPKPTEPSAKNSKSNQVPPRPGDRSAAPAPSKQPKNPFLEHINNDN